MGCRLKLYDNPLIKEKHAFNENHFEMKDNINPDDDVSDLSEEYFQKKGNANDTETEIYFPQENSKPPHY